MSTGSLGNGLAVGLGMALSARLHHQDYMTYVMLGDGEVQEGMVWEAAMAANHHNADNLIAIVDCNGVQINGWVNDVMTIEPLADKWRAFGWCVVEVNGHNMRDVLTALHTAKTMRHPTVDPDAHGQGARCLLYGGRQPLARERTQRRGAGAGHC